MPFWNKPTADSEHAGLERLLNALDPYAEGLSHAASEARIDQVKAFAEFSFGIRQRHMQRLVATTVRRAKLAKLPKFHYLISLDHAAQELKSQFDFDSVGRAKRAAERIVGVPTAWPERDEKVAEAVRAARMVSHAGMLTSYDISWYLDEFIPRDLASRIAANTLEIVAMAYEGDGRASGRFGSAVASANAQVAVQQAAREHVKWLERAAAAA